MKGVEAVGVCQLWIDAGPTTNDAIVHRGVCLGTRQRDDKRREVEWRQEAACAGLGLGVATTRTKEHIAHRLH